MVKTESFYTLFGKTGVGKTDVLQALNELGYPVLDLEALAFHRGSVFGATGKRQPRTSDFRALCEAVFKQHNQEMPLFSEWKGKNVGKLKIPFEVISKMSNGNAILLDRPVEERTQRLLKTYGSLDIKDLYGSLFLLKERMDEDHFNPALNALDQGLRADFITAMLSYYDKRYAAQIKTLGDPTIEIDCMGMDGRQIAERIKKGITGFEK